MFQGKKTRVLELGIKLMRISQMRSMLLTSEYTVHKLLSPESLNSDFCKTNKGILNLNLVKLDHCFSLSSSLGF